MYFFYTCMIFIDLSSVKLIETWVSFSNLKWSLAAYCSTINIL